MYSAKYLRIPCKNETFLYTEWQRPLSGVHSIMMEKLTQAGLVRLGGGGCILTPFYDIYHHVQSCGGRSS
jgi:hypothetical protein